MGAAATPARAVEVFYSCAHENEELRDLFDKHLSQLEGSGLIRDWRDRKIGAGSKWAGEINEHFERADIIL